LRKFKAAHSASFENIPHLYLSREGKHHRSVPSFVIPAKANTIEAFHHCLSREGGNPLRTTNSVGIWNFPLTSPAPQSHPTLRK
jgi:hypothetical protein